MSEKNGASPEIGAVLQKILARLDVIEQREQQQDAIEALRGNSGRRGAAAVDGARVDASVDEPASDRGGPSSDVVGRVGCVNCRHPRRFTRRARSQEQEP